MAKYHVETDNGTYEVEVADSPDTSAVPPPSTNSPGLLDTMSNAADKITSTIPAVAGLMSPTLGMAQYAGEKMNEASGQLGGAVTQGAAEGWQIPKEVPFIGGKRLPQVPGVGAALLGAGAAAVSNPMTYMNPEAGLNKDFSLPPAVGKPGMAARIKQMRTGVDAGEFERLRRDPTAFFNTTPRAEAGAAIGDAKQAAGISTGVTGDIQSLTPENINKARNLQGVANKAQNTIIENLDKSILPIKEPGATTGPAHALYAYSDEMGPGGAKRDIYNVYGDKNDPLITQSGHGSSVPKEALDKLGIPVTGREPRTEATVGIKPNDVSLALDGINKRLSKIERSEGRGSPSFQQWTAIKSHFQNLLEQVAPDVKAANKDFSRVAMRDKFMEPFPVNQSGTMSKIDQFGFNPGAAGVGALLGGLPGAVGAYAAKTAIRSPFIAGLGTAVRGLADKALDPALTKTTNVMSRRGGIGNMIDPSANNDEERNKAYASFISKVTTR